jgi:proteasome accessory factor B
MADRVERLTNLLALLLETTEPLSLVQIASELEGQYPPQDGARRQAFERDKQALRELGIPIDTEVVAGGPYAGQTRYRIDRRKYELTDLDLDAREMHALQVAVAAVRTDSTAGQSALWKLGGAIADEQPPVSAMVPQRPELPIIRSAVAQRATITFGYRGQERRLEPWGLLLRGGFWYVVGRDDDKDEQRTFRVDRFDRVPGIRLGDAGAFERPRSFDPRSAFPADPKLIGYRAEDSVDATVRVDRRVAAQVIQEVGEERVLLRQADGSVDVSVPAANLDAFRSWVLGMLDHAVVIEPPEIRAHLRQWLADVVTAHQAGG